MKIEDLKRMRDEILSEFNYHAILDFCNGDCFKYETVKEIREDLRERIDYFIERHSETGIYSLYDYKWHIGIEEDYLVASFRPEIASACS